MKTTFLTTSSILLALAACSGRTIVPVAPSALPAVSAPAAPAAPAGGPGSGTIAIREVSPGAGAVLPVKRDCVTGRTTRVCADAWRGTFDVLVDREMTNAVLTVSFYDGQTKCGYAANTMEVVPAGTRVSFTIDRIYLSDEFGTFASPCRLPAMTSRIAVELWSDWSSWTNTLVQDFSGIRYTFQE
jgi:hypothetical protein